MKIIQENISKIKKLCEDFYVVQLFVFGSMAQDKYTDGSDIDFLVQFSGVDPLEYFDNYLNFKNELEKLFCREIDLVEVQTINNPILKRSIDRDKINIYGREDSKMAV